MTINLPCKCFKKNILERKKGSADEMGQKKGLRRELQKNHRRRKEGARDVHASLRVSHSYPERRGDLQLGTLLL